MKIIIVGCGKVGSVIAQRLSAEDHEVIVIDKNPEVLKAAADRMDVLGLEGSGTSYETLLEAGIKNTDLLIATTDSDEHNLLAALFAKRGNDECHTIARIRDPEYFSNIRYIREELNLSMVINPELAAAREISKLVRFPAALKIDTFARGRVDLIKLVLPKECVLDGVKIFEIGNKSKCDVLICVVERGEEVIIPKGDFALNNGDTVWFIADHKNALGFIKYSGVSVTGAVKNLMLIGGGRLSYYTAKLLEDTGINTKIIEIDEDRCRHLSEELPKTMIINGDGTEKELLLEEGINNMDAVVSMTGIDEENIMLSLYVGATTDAKILTKINKITFKEVIGTLNLGSIINPKNITADAIVSYVRAMSNSMGSNVASLCKIASDKAEALEFRVSTDSDNLSYVGVPLKGLMIKSDLIIACIIHNGIVHKPNGDSVIEKGDTVIVVTTQKGLDDLEDILL